MPTLAVRLLRAAVPPDPWGDTSTRPVWRQLLPHVRAITDASRTFEPTGEDVAWLLDRAGLYLLARGEPISARPLVERALGRYGTVLGENHPDTLASADKLVTDLRALGRDDEARQLEEWVRSHS
ncbi:MAG: tetratricopeptide repeat protein [Pseudonocardiaceae bacterium]